MTKASFPASVLAVALALTACVSINASVIERPAVDGVVLLNGTNLALAALPRIEATATVHGQTHVFNGPALIDVAALAANIQQPVRGSDLGVVVVVIARDGYVAAFGVGELDAATSGRTILLADQVDGRPLPDSDGPWRVVVAGDTRGARMVRMVERIEVIQP